MPASGSLNDSLIMPGSPYNGQSVTPVLTQLNNTIRSGDPQARAKAISDIQQIIKLPQFQGIGWQNLLLMLGTIGGGALISAVTGSSPSLAAAQASLGVTGTPAATAGAGTSLGSVAAGAVPELGSLPTAAIPAASVGIPTATAGANTVGGISGIIGSLFSRNNIPNLISGGSALLGSILQGRAANNAAGLQANAANQAAQLQSQTAQQNLDFLKQVYGNEQAANAPFLQAGQNALSQVQALLAPGGDLSKDFTAPTAAEVQQTPGYQLQLDEAMKALGRQTRGVTSGQTLKAAERFANDYAATNYDQATNRALNIFQTNRANRLNPLLTIAGYGPQAVNAGNQAGQNASNANTNINSELANNLGSLGLATANTQGAAGVAGTNALTQALQQISNLAQQRQALTRSSV